MLKTAQHLGQWVSLGTDITFMDLISIFCFVSVIYLISIIYLFTRIEIDRFLSKQAKA